MNELIKNNIDQETISNSLIDSPKLSFLSKLYIWSLIFEPLLFFLLATGGQSTGIPLSISRLLQILVVLIFLFRMVRIRKDRLQFYFFNNNFNKYFVFYIFILFVSSILGVILFDSYELTFRSNTSSGDYRVPLLKSRYIRPLFDIFLLIYYYSYFIILAKHLINSSLAINYYFKYFLRSFYLILLMGFVDLAHSFIRGYALITRHFGESTDVGARFHSFIGEPRDAFVFLVYASLIIVVQNMLYVNIKYISIKFFLIFSAALLTQSASGIVGIIIGSILAFCYFSIKGNFKIFYFLGFIAILSCMFFILLPYSPRTLMYMDAFSTIFEDLKAGIELPKIVMVQSTNFLPIWGLYNHFINFNFYQFLFGSGFSSSAYYNFNYIGNNEISNPNAQITRLLFEGGFIGTLTYLIFLMKPALKFLISLSGRANYNSIFIFFLLSGASLAHRSIIPFILIGLILAYNNINHSGTKR
jgi:hypothetical protein